MSKPQSVTKWCIQLGAMAVVLAIGALPASAGFIFTETFAAPPLTAGTSGGNFVDGWNNGDNGWIVVESGGSSGSGFRFGQRVLADLGHDRRWPGGGVTEVGTVRNQTQGWAYAAQSLVANPLVSGNVSISLADLLPHWDGGVFELLFVGGAGEDQTAMVLRFGGLFAPGDRFGVQQLANHAQAPPNVILELFGQNALAGDGRNLLWQARSPALGTGDVANGNFATLSVDFDVVTGKASVVVTSTNAAGSSSSTAPVVVDFTQNIDSLTRVTLVQTPGVQRNPGNAVGYLTYISEIGISGTIIPEPASLAMLGLAGLIALRRRR